MYGRAFKWIWATVLRPIQIQVPSVNPMLASKFTPQIFTDHNVCATFGKYW